jgi:hypothetical protein
MSFLKNLFAKKKEKEFSKKQRLKKFALKKINKIEKIRLSKKRFNKLSIIFRIFVKKSLRIKKQMTHKELIKEIESKKIKTRLKKKIILLSSEINQIKFANQRLSKQKLEEMFKKLKEIIEEF